MKIILDNNIFFSLMKPDSSASKIFKVMQADFMAPEFIKRELDKYVDICQKKSGLNKNSFNERKKEVESKIEFIKLSKFKDKLNQAKNVIIDPDDAPYIALSLKENTPIWSNDNHFKQQKAIPVFTTLELLELIT